MSKLENIIEEKEKEIKNIETEMLKEENSTNYLKLKELQDIIQDKNKIIEEKMMEWEELSHQKIEI